MKAYESDALGGASESRQRRRLITHAVQALEQLLQALAKANPQADATQTAGSWRSNTGRPDGLASLPSDRPPWRRCWEVPHHDEGRVGDVVNGGGTDLARGGQYRPGAHATESAHRKRHVTGLPEDRAAQLQGGRGVPGCSARGRLLDCAKMLNKRSKGAIAPPPRMAQIGPNSGQARSNSENRFRDSVV